MTIYWSACLASMAIAWMGMKTDRGRENLGLLVVLSGLPLMLVAALRYNVGADYLLTYVPYFERVSSSYQASYDRMEWLFHLINWLVAALNGDYQWVFAVSAVLFTLFVYGQIFHDSPWPALSIFLLVGMGYYFVSFNAMRQMVGCAILMYAIRYIENRRMWRFLLCVGIAAGFHLSCTVFAAMYWLGRVRLKPGMMLLLTAAVAALGQLIGWLIRLIISMTRYSVYFSSVFDTGETALVMLAINAVVLLLGSMCWQEDGKYRVYYNLQVLACWITLLSGNVVLLLRLLWMFGLPSVIMLPLAIGNIPGSKSRKLVIAVVLLLFFAYATYTVGVQNSNDVLPYQTIFSRWI